MSILNSVANIFRPAGSGTPAAAPALQQQQQAPMSQQNPAAGNGAPPAGTSQPTQGGDPNAAGAANPLDAFQAIWQNDPNAQPQADPFAAPLFKPDNAAIAASASRMNFVQGMPAEQKQALAEAIRNGDTDTILNAMNYVGQQALLAATHITTATAEQAGQRIAQRVRQDLPSRVRDIQLSQTVPDNPVLQHPAAQPVINLLKTQIAQKNPTMTPAQVAKEAEKYVLTLASAASPTQASQTAAGSGEQDWDIFLNG